MGFGPTLPLSTYKVRDMLFKLELIGKKTEGNKCQKPKSFSHVRDNSRKNGTK